MGTRKAYLILLSGYSTLRTTKLALHPDKKLQFPLVQLSMPGHDDEIHTLVRLQPKFICLFELHDTTYKIFFLTSAKLKASLRQNSHKERVTAKNVVL